jgi:hypothetical protein
MIIVLCKLLYSIMLMSVTVILLPINEDRINIAE